MAAKTTWSPAPWLPKQTWLLKDGSVVQTPDLETTTSGQRLRVAGTTKSFGKGKIDDMLLEAVRGIATQRLTEPWIKLIDDDSARRSVHGGMSPGPGGTPDYSEPVDLDLLRPGSTARGHIQLTYEYVSEECPALTATMWIIIDRYGSERFRIMSSLTYQVVHESRAQDKLFQRWAGSSEQWFTPFSYYDNGPFAQAAKEFHENLRPFGEDFELADERVNHNSRLLVVDALKMLKKLRDIEFIDVPVWRTSDAPSTMRYKFKRTNVTNAVYNELLDLVQVRPTLDRIRENYRQILSDMASLGIVMSNRRSNYFQQIAEEAFAEDVVCHIIPLTADGNPEVDGNGTPIIEEDHAHTVSVDLMSGTIVVNCAQGDTEVLEHWNFERTKAELHGELDAFLGFAQKKQARQGRKKFKRIVKERTPEEFSPESLNA